MTSAPPKLEGARRLVVKIGSALLVDEPGRRVRRPWLEALSDDLAALKAGGCEIVVVSSGAIALGRHQLGLHRRSMRLEESQAAAATGSLCAVATPGRLLNSADPSGSPGSRAGSSKA